ncbi:unnamed protein product [Parnassius apollo]|uniref:(apollo) hypothetical protein n=1 Tax=Parnassius apollo TaxID=110799 RepID=A0A8S3XWJ7_PARAO|nr:unnamed protein product [Parnassius apollo]
MGLTVLNDPDINKKPRLKNKWASQKKEKKSTTKKSVTKRKRTPSITTTDESIEMSVHSDSDLLDCLSDILPDNFDTWNKTDLNYERKKTELEPLSKDQVIKQIVKNLQEVEKTAQTCNTCDETIETKDIWKDKDSDYINTLDKATQKVTMLSSVKLTPENQAFYKTHGSLQLKPINIDRDIFIDLKEKKLQNTDIGHTSKKKIKNG